MAKNNSSETSEPQSLRVLMVEDSEDDALLTIHALKKGGYDPVYERVENAEAMRTALREKTWDIIVCDYQLPQFNGPAAIALLKETGIDIPMIIVSGAIGEETAADCMRYGAHDYIMKGNLSRLVPAIERELQEAESRRKRKQAEEKLLNVMLQQELILSSAAEGILGLDSQGNHTFINTAAAKILGYEAEELLGRPSHTMWHHTKPDGSPFPEEECRIHATYREGAVYRNSTEVFWRKDGTCFPVEYASTPIYEKGKLIGAVVTFMDITERKQAEEALRESERRFMDVLYSAPDAVLLIDGEKFVDCNEATARMLGYADRNEFLMTHPSKLSPPTQPDGRSSFEKANEMMSAALERGFLQFEWEHRRASGEDFPVEVSLTSIVLHGKNVIYCMWRELTERKRAEEELQRTLDSLRKAVNTTIQVMVSAVETRDPYTAGHQLRSANLARAIATELGLPPEKIEGIWMAGSIHDVGKLSVPAEILSKPTKLSAIELSLIKEHANRGYEILKGVESSWPLAEIVRQHHERMDGSGYPRNLKGEEILMEARILSVADVVEAMASHRPYRPALGINAALEELEKNKGILYDDAVADACLRLFREKGFKIEGV